MRAKNLLGSVLKLLATGSVSLLIAACYGVSMLWKTITITALSPEGTGIPALDVTLLDGTTTVGSTTTDAAGDAQFDQMVSVEGMQATIVDVDGAANGGDFQQTTITLDTRDAYEVTLARE